MGAEIREQKIQNSRIILVLLLSQTWRSGMFQSQGSLKAVSRERPMELLFKVYIQGWPGVKASLLWSFCTQRQLFKGLQERLHWDVALWGLVEHKAGCLANKIHGQDMQLSRMNRLVHVYPKFICLILQIFRDTHCKPHLQLLAGFGLSKCPIIFVNSASNLHRQITQCVWGKQPVWDF